MKLRLGFGLRLTLLLIIASNLSGCIHLLVGDSGPEKAEDLIYSPPTKPFVILKNQEADHSWQSKSSGNIIAFYSDCSKSSDKPLSLAVTEILKGFDRIDEQSQESLFYNNREALQIKLRGFIDGIAVSMETLVFNKNQCFYQISYSGVTAHFVAEIDYFEKFKKEFKAP